ncbi:MAG: hypothetical protein DMG99_01085 [Acidobacteria bacterium]|nr:MAG: hypothetical protein DMG99_01085 [Acidobacteriota bacterium]
MTFLPIRTYRGAAVKFRLQLLVSLTITVILFSASLPSSFAQTFSASLAGVVTDPSGSAVPGAKVHLRNMGTNEVRDAISSAVGSYKFDNLLPATYEITAAGEYGREYQFAACSRGDGATGRRHRRSGTARHAICH